MLNNNILKMYRNSCLQWEFDNMCCFPKKWEEEENFTRLNMITGSLGNFGESTLQIRQDPDLQQLVRIRIVRIFLFLGGWTISTKMTFRSRPRDRPWWSGHNFPEKIRIKVAFHPHQPRHCPSNLRIFDWKQWELGNLVQHGQGWCSVLHDEETIRLEGN